MNINLPEHLPGEKLLIRLIDTTEKGLGGLFRPWQLKRVHKANLENKNNEMLMIARAEKDIELFKRGEVIIDPVTYQVTPKFSNEEVSDDNYIHKVLSEQTCKTLIKEVNISKAILHAKENLIADDSNPPEEMASQDWLSQWAEYVGLISDEQLQQLWGKLLAGEIKAPGKYSLRTLNFIKHISKEDTEKIYKASSFIIRGFIFKNPYDEASDIPLELLLYLQELGIIQGVESTSLHQTFYSSYLDRFELTTYFGRMFFNIKSSERNKVLSLPAYAITSLGKEVFSLVNNIETNEAYLIGLAKYIVRQGFEVQISLNWTILPNGMVNILDSKDITLG